MVKIKLKLRTKTGDRYYWVNSNNRKKYSKVARGVYKKDEIYKQRRVVRKKRYETKQDYDKYIDRKTVSIIRKPIERRTTRGTYKMILKGKVDENLKDINNKVIQYRNKLLKTRMTQELDLLFQDAGKMQKYTIKVAKILPEEMDGIVEEVSRYQGVKMVPMELNGMMKVLVEFKGGKLIANAGLRRDSKQRVFLGIGKEIKITLA